MYDADQLVKHTRKGNPSRFETVTDTYRFDPQFKNGQVSKVVAIFQPGHGYRTIVHIDGKALLEMRYHDGQWPDSIWTICCYNINVICLRSKILANHSHPIHARPE
jgi:hypothetical protein